MIDLAPLREHLADRHAAGDFTPMMLELTLKPCSAALHAVSADGSELNVRHADGTIEVLRASELAAIALA